MTGAFFVVYFSRFSVSLVLSFFSQDRSQLRTLRVGMVKSNNMAKSGRKVARKERPVMKPQGYMPSKRDVQNFGARPKFHKHAQLIVHDGISRGHTAVFDTWDQKSIIGIDV